MTLARETVFLGLICLADLLLTALLISSGSFTEANPVLGYYLRFGLAAMCGVKLFSFVAPLAMAEWYRRKDPQFVQSMLRAILYLYVVGYVAGVTAVNLPMLLFGP
jgi:type IV secretory pathway TrbD component